MPKTRKNLIPALLALSLSAPAAAADEQEGTFFGHDATGKWIVGIKAGVLQNGTEGFDDATNAGIVLGYRFSRAIGGIGGSSSIEFEGTTSVDDGEFSSGVGAGTWDADTFAIFFTYATPGTVYFKAKLGGMFTDVSSSVNQASNSDSGFAYGAGLGLKIAESGKLELEYTGSSGSNEISFVSLGGMVEF